MYKQLLERAKEIINRGWTKFQMAQDVNGKAVSFTSEAAVCFCSYGAFRRACYELNVHFLSKDADTAFYLVRKNVPMPHSSVLVYNDDPKRTKEEILDLFQRAIDSKYEYE